MATFETGGEQPDVAARVATWVGEAVSLIRSRTVDPAAFVARVLVYGLLAAAVGVVVLILSIDAVVKLLDAYAFGNRVWITEFVVAALSLAGSAVAWRRMGRARRRLGA
ncbi:hypothetical protein Afer_0029 [Acidimicrobium ferrooxidans DSM 10331]|uniref:Holin-X, holin superfamily III n=1 Tax=Acidimicrobium ferrooxidans (strain DSM 10331 / JCM 15462 / NBRC 103882 / ICP) TaxID=525909 RepID=C7M1F5_ACIFD|nr:hypothetical protein [Acidimicrobium ferrooxidans]ACU53004.1 hypothetical protein Afer_0029 [Acidimicrobium ferrooxidans DSM 10331]